MSIDFKPRTSKLLAWVLGGFHALCAVVVISYVQYKPAAAALLLLTLWSWYRAYRLHCQYRGGKAVRRVQWQVDGQWMLEDAAHQSHPALLMPSSYLHPRLLILNFKLVGSGHRRNVVLLPDSLDVQTLRRLRSRLRIEGAAQDPNSLTQT